jgi:hypothetical protein
VTAPAARTATRAVPATVLPHLNDERPAMTAHSTAQHQTFAAIAAASARARVDAGLRGAA